MHRALHAVVACVVVVPALAWSKPAGKPATGPLTPKERVVLQGATCEQFRATLKEAVDKATEDQPSTTTQSDIVQAVVTSLAKPATINDADWHTCLNLTIRDLQEFKVRSIEVEAVTMLKSIGTGVIAHYNETQKLCPSTTPAPADTSAVLEGAYTTQPGDWDATWQCTGVTPPDQQRFQYVMAVKGKGFTITAKGYPSGPATLRTLTITGKATPEGVKLSEITRQ